MKFGVSRLGVADRLRVLYGEIIVGMHVEIEV
jgi:hypothetical protein